ncbi:MAG: J domain-containing protein, partial [Gammaproteobacteria bacterium]|nr:J domain-containing protein [Gammaproteobacteria bacterium]
MKNRRNFYRILHVQPDAPTEIIKASYRALMTKLDRHPDRGGDHETAALINEAFAVLGDEAKRRHDDQTLLNANAETDVGGMRRRRRPSPDYSGPRQTQSYEPAIQYYCAFCMTPHAYGGKRAVGSRLYRMPQSVGSRANDETGPVGTAEHAP